MLRASLIHGRAGTALLQGMISSANEHQAAPYIGEGTNEWMGVHVDDLADLYVAAITGEHPGIYNATARDEFTMRELAEAIAELTGTVAVSLTLDQALAGLGPAAALLTRSTPLDPNKVEHTFGWQPRRAELIEDVRAGSYPIAAS